MTSEIEYVSLGSWCLTSHMLKLAKVKKASYPLDWVFSNQEMIENLFNNINIFESTQLSSKEGKTQHKKYGTIFNHHDPLYNENDYAYFQRCIDRFTKLNTKDVVYFVLILNHEVDEEKLERLLSSRISNYKLIILDKSFGPLGVEKTISSDKRVRIKISSPNDWTGDNWNAHIDNEIDILISIIRNPIIDS